MPPKGHSNAYHAFPVSHLFGGDESPLSREEEGAYTSTVRMCHYSIAMPI